MISGRKITDYWNSVRLVSIRAIEFNDELVWSDMVICSGPFGWRRVHATKWHPDIDQFLDDIMAEVRHIHGQFGGVPRIKLVHRKADAIGREHQ